MAAVAKTALDPRAPPPAKIGWEHVTAAVEAGKLSVEDLPPLLPGWLEDVWILYARVRTQVREAGTLDYNPVIRLVEAAGAAERLWSILELLQAIELEMMPRKEDVTGG